MTKHKAAVLRVSKKYHLRVSRGRRSPGGYVYDNILEVNSLLDQAIGGLHGRLWDRQSTHRGVSPGEGEPWLIGRDKEKALGAYANILKARDLTNRAAQALNGIDLGYGG